MKNKLLLVALLSTSLFGLKAQFGNALDFDGSNDYVTAPVPTIFNSISSQNFTIEFKIKPAMFTTNRVLYVQTSTSNFASVMLNSSGKVYFYAPNLGVVTGSSIPINAWTHVAIVKTSTSTAEIYFNGVLQVTSGGGTSTTSTVNLLGIGAKPDGSQYFKGVIDEFRIWDGARTASEITSNMNSSLTLPQTGLVTYYKFNQGVANGSNPTVTTLNDELTTANGTLNNFALTGTTSNWVGSEVLSVNESLLDHKISIVPNPVKNELNVIGLIGKTAYVLTNSVGQKVMEGILSKEKSKVDVPSLKTGMYFMTLGDKQLKFVKE